MVEDVREKKNIKRVLPEQRWVFRKQNRPSWSNDEAPKLVHLLGP